MENIVEIFSWDLNEVYKTESAINWTNRDVIRVSSTTIDKDVPHTNMWQAIDHNKMLAEIL